MRLKPDLTFAWTLLALLPGLSMAWTPDDLLLRAIRNGDHAGVQSLLAGAADPDRQLADGSTPLAWAVESQDREMVQLLLAAGADPGAGANPSAAPLIIACQYGDSVILDLLLDAEADVNFATADGIAPLAVCAGNAPAGIIERLLGAGAAVDAADNLGQTPLMQAAAKGRVENIRLLIEHGADVNRTTVRGFTPLLFALKSGAPAAPVLVFEAGGNADYIAPDGTSVVQLAMYQKDYAFAARMMERGANLTAFDRNGNQLLHAAVLAGAPELVSLLLANGAEMNVPTGPSQVEWRFERNFTAADYYVPPKTPLLLAAERGDAGLMRLLVHAGADTGLLAEDGTSVVLAAAASGTFAALELALEIEPDPNITNASGDTALHMLLNSGGRTDGSPAEYAPMLQLLAAKGARIDISNKRGQTPADLATEAQTEVKALFYTNFGTGMATL